MKIPNLFTYNMNELTMNMQTSQSLSIRTVELFAGVGGFRLGLEKTSLENKSYSVVWSNQWEPSTKTQHASDIYCARFGYENHSNDDISTVDASVIPDHDLLVGGFPCQDYSVASTLKNSHGIVGKKGVLWWEIYRILKQKKEKAPKYLLLENVDRLLKSPAAQRGRDFAIILSSLNSLGYGVEWRVINASDYGMPQRRRRVFIMAYKNGTKPYLNLQQKTPFEVLSKDGIFAKTFPIKMIQEDDIFSLKLSDDLVDITDNFNKNTSNKNSFYDSGYMIDGVYYTATCKAEHEGNFSVLGDFLQDEKDVPKEFYISDEELEKWKYHKNSKSIERVHKTTGHKYLYSEGSMSFPDCLKKPSRTIITGEGGASASRFKHVVCVDGRHRRLTPVELERLNMFPDNHTAGVSDSKRAFLMGNALVVGIVEKLGNVLLKEI
ncbi:DNA (cytosine-5-)-methyltransferase [Sulfurimonas denitrificans DSM 1251]|uniref:Cytosine-specific methyltransferase n=1 Tax=Sulfurimonas denitrificans (strain ATCC 33889 / DSM 1251) TaxID=326298 RepID=Q30PF2_SULDN|nr:DNA (cytosine-5-)-methyltransferase [Sulfurimonas denitrificans]ABB45129.1 DNA (cytosine-5-)-methyltransferase [Sulfurimonas denitrificans DSM 1251]MDD3442804.1 DNA (cytosine-5-)-methyltransferase [Sulfurimonas denitrificans]